MTYRIIQGDVLDGLSQIATESVHTCVTSPPYWGLRDYGVDGQLGLERTPGEYVARMVAVFREVLRVLRPDGTVWLNLGDSYGQGGGQKNPCVAAKQLCGIPWRVAFALQADGWFLRQDIIWAKPNPMPEPVKDRCTKAHEYLFLLSKSPRYYFDSDAIREEFADKRKGNPGVYKAGLQNCITPRGVHGKGVTGKGWNRDGSITGRNRRSVWTVPPKGFPGAHFATFPPDLVRPCILAGAPEDGTVLDPFCGSGTTGMVSIQHGRRFIGVELNPQYVEMAHKRISDGCLVTSN